MMSSMSEDSHKNRRKYIYDLPYPERKKLCQILDADKKWEELGGRFMDVPPIELSAIGRAIYHRGSPTDELLNWFGMRNGTIEQLFVYLSHMNHQWAMTAIVNYVSPKYHCLLNKCGMDFASEEISPSKLLNGAPSPSAPMQSQTWAKSSELIGATGIDRDFAKLQVNSDNFNQSSSQSTIHPQKVPYPSRNPQTNGRDPYQTRHKPSPVVNGDTSKFLNGSRPSYSPRNSELNGNVQHCRPGPTREPELKNGVRSCDVKPKMKLNIPVSNATSGFTEKLNKVGESKVPADNNNYSEDLLLFMKIPYSELVQATDNFDKARILGQGGFGIVYKAYWKGNNVAVKKISPKSKNKTDTRIAGQVSLKQSQTEMRVLYQCRMDNILPLYGVSMDGPEPCLVYQFMVNGSLEDKLLVKGNSKPLTWEQRFVIALGTARGLHYMHSMPDKPLIHGDIKSANILLDKDMEPKIGDFGLARDGPSDYMTHVKVSSVHGTQVYLPYEYLRSYQLSEKVDVYSYGIVLLEIATGLRAYNEKLPKNKYLTELVNSSEEDGICLRDVKAGIEKEAWFEEILRTGKQCSSHEKRCRPTMAEVLERFNYCQQKIETFDKIRKLSNQLPEAPALSPMGLQLFYDLKNGPDFLSGYPTGVQGPPLLDHGLTLPSSIPSFHPSEIRGPPSQVNTGNGFMSSPDSSCAATVGSSPKSEQMLPLLTELGMNQATTVSSAMSGIPGRDKVVITPKMVASEMQLFSDDGDAGSGENEDIEILSSFDSEGLFQMTND